MTPPTVPGVLVVLAVGIPVSLGVAVVFHRLVERPSQVLAGWVGRAARRRFVAEPQAGETVRLPAVGDGDRPASSGVPLPPISRPGLARLALPNRRPPTPVSSGARQAGT